MRKKIHYHGGPMWGNVDIGPKKIWCGDVLYKESCALVSYARPEQLKRILPIACSVILDNGAFSIWRKNNANPSFDWDAHWAGYYAWVMRYLSAIDWFIVPDVIEGTEAENDRLLGMVPSQLRPKAAPVWHSVESIERLVSLCESFDRVCIGLCGDHSKPTSFAARDRLTEAFDSIYVKRRIKVKIHGLRMLDGRILGSFPFDSADSSFVAVNVPKIKKQMPQVECRLARTSIYKNKIEGVYPITIDDYKRRRL